MGRLLTVVDTVFATRGWGEAVDAAEALDDASFDALVAAPRALGLAVELLAKARGRTGGCVWGGGGVWEVQIGKLRTLLFVLPALLFPARRRLPSVCRPPRLFAHSA